MKVLFAIKDDNNIIESLIRKYENDYEEKVIYKEVKNFTAIIKELQQNKNYDRIVISDDFDEKINQSENKESILLKKLNTLVEIARKKSNKQIPIIYITQNKKTLSSLYELNIFNAIIGKDKIKSKIYALLEKERTKNQAKEYYGITENQKISKVQEVKENDDDKLSKMIKSLNKEGLTEETYVRRFEKAYTQLDKESMQKLIKSLSSTTKKILKQKSDIYKKLVTTNSNNNKPNKTEETKKRGRGRPRKEKIEEIEDSVVKAKRGRGRPRKETTEEVLETKTETNKKTTVNKSVETKRDLEKEKGKKLNTKKVEPIKSKEKINNVVENVKSKAKDLNININSIQNKKKVKSDDSEKIKLEEISKVIENNKSKNKPNEKNEKTLDIFDEEFDFDNEIIDNEKEFKFDNQLKNYDNDFDYEEDEILEDEDFNYEEDEALEDEDFDYEEDEILEDEDFDYEEDEVLEDEDFNYEEDEALEDEDFNYEEDEILEDEDFDYEEDEVPEDEDFDYEEDENLEDEDFDYEEDEDFDYEEDENLEEEDFDFEEYQETSNDNNDLLEFDNGEEEDILNLDEEDDDDILNLDEEDDILNLDEDDDILNLDEEDEDDDILNLDEEEDEDDDILNLDEEEEDDDILNLDEEDEDDDILNLNEEEDDDILNLDEEDEDDDILNLDEEDEDDDILNLDEEDEDDDILNLDEEDEDDDILNLDEEDDDDDILNLDEEDDDILNLNEEDEDDNILNLDKKDEEDNILNLDEEDEDDDILNLDEEEDDDNGILDIDEEDDDILDFDDDEFLISENKLLENDDNLKIKDELLDSDNNSNFKGIKNKNYIPNYDISKQIHEINGETSANTEVKNMLIANENTAIANENILNVDGLKIGPNQRIIAFVGTHGNGTSFIINNIAQLLSEQGIKTAILDLTKNKNSYYIYTENEERLRSISYSCFEKLKSGIPDGIKVNKNLSVYTSLPNSDNEIENKEVAINTLLNNYSLILLDCDFDTDLEYYNIAQEIYLVQSFDILTIQPLTSFMKKLKMNKVLNEERIKIILNKCVNVSGISEKVIVAAMSVYNSPDTTYQLDLFDRNKVEYFTIPFEEKNYAKYLDELVKCKLTLRGYTKSLLNSFNKLSKSIYPINGKKNKLK